MKNALRALVTTLRDRQMQLGILTESAFVLGLVSAGLLLCFLLGLA